jgi:hypothetical protein
MIVQQCDNCAKRGKKAYCNNCLLKPDYFDIFRYDPNSDRFGKGSKELRVKAYTWNDVLEYVKNNFFDDKTRNNLNINCEKDFAYLEEKSSGQAKENNSVNGLGKGPFLGYKVYLINKDEIFEQSTVKADKFCDLTVVLSNDCK